MLWTLTHTADILLWLIMAGSVVYVLFFALASLFPKRKKDYEEHIDPCSDNEQRTFLVLFPAYNEDSVITSSVETFLLQDYPADRYHVAVVSDHMSRATNETLKAMPITLHTPRFDRSSKAKALQYAMSNTPTDYDYVVILDADNTVESDFLTRLNRSCRHGYTAIQCHRCAKNADSDVALLDGVSEEINNTLFRKAHNRVGLSSALIGSGMCFDFRWFRANVGRLSTAGEDRELEALLVRARIYIRYEESIHVRDEKVSSGNNFQRQRQRWMSAQLNSLCSMLPYMPKAAATGNINFVDKTIQQMLIPRSILLVITFIMAVVTLVAAPAWSVKWWLLAAALCLALVIATPRPMRTLALVRGLPSLPALAWKMLTNVRRIDRRNKDFIHTTHNK